MYFRAHNFYPSLILFYMILFWSSIVRCSSVWSTHPYASHHPLHCGLLVMGKGGVRLVSGVKEKPLPGDWIAGCHSKLESSSWANHPRPCGPEWVSCYSEMYTWEEDWRTEDAEGGRHVRRGGVGWRMDWWMGGKMWKGTRSKTVGVENQDFYVHFGKCHLL